MRNRRLLLLMIALVTPFAPPSGIAGDEPLPGDDATFRPTVVVRHGTSLGTGTIVASVPGETLVLTAAHVVAGEAGPTRITLFRFNLGLEETAKESAFPKQFAATVAARDVDADVAILRVSGLPALPFQAKVEMGGAPPDAGTVVASLGYDHGERPIGWTTKFRRTARLRIRNGGVDRSFLLTDDPPVEGRSGGGLYREDGTLVGVCVGRLTPDSGRTIGLFSPVRNVHSLLLEHPDLAASLRLSQGAIQARSR